jgi:hypothetical protein
MPSEPHSTRSAGRRRVTQLGEKDDVREKNLSKLPAHVKSVQDGLLDFNHFVGLQAAMLAMGDEETGDNDENCIPLSAYKTDGVAESQRAMDREFVQTARVLAKGAQSINFGPHEAA